VPVDGTALLAEQHLHDQLAHTLAASVFTTAACLMRKSMHPLLWHSTHCVPFAQEREMVVLPRTPDTLSPARTVRLSMVRVFEFSSHSLRSGAVVIPSDVSDGSGLLFLRGAPGVIRSLVRQESVPPDFDEVGPKHHSSSGFL